MFKMGIIAIITMQGCLYDTHMDELYEVLRIATATNAANVKRTQSLSSRSFLLGDSGKRRGQSDSVKSLMDRLWEHIGGCRTVGLEEEQLGKAIK